MALKPLWRLLVFSLLMAVSAFLTWCFHAVLGVNELFTHFFYLPIILACYWWGRRGIVAAVALGAMLVASDALVLKVQDMADDLLRCAAFIGVGMVVAILRESEIRSEMALKQANKELAKENEARKRAEETIKSANRKLSLLSKITRHDILNRLSIVEGFMKLEADAHPSAESAHRQELMDSALKSIKRDMEFTREYEEIGAHGPDWQPVAGVFEQAMLKLGMGNVKVNVGVVGVEVFADRMLMKVFYNLLEDSLGHGGNVTRVGLSQEVSGEDMIIAYEDNGHGIPLEEKDRIFDLGIVSKGGSGLFLAREILAITGITILENGQPGKGARFEIRVPKGTYRIA